VEGQNLMLEVSYPKRKVAIGGKYELKIDSFDTNLNMKWNSKRNDDDDDDENNSEQNDDDANMKSVDGSFQWKDLTDTTNLNHQSILFTLKHPKFEKDITLQGVYYTDVKTVAKVEIDIDYTEDEDQHAKFIAELNNLSEDVGFTNYTVFIKGDHHSSELHFVLDSSLGIKPNNYKMEATGTYKRSFLPEMELEMVGFLNIDHKEVKFYVSH
jgi:hypothetical protein